MSDYQQILQAKTRLREVEEELRQEIDAQDDSELEEERLSLIEIIRKYAEQREIEKSYIRQRIKEAKHELSQTNPKTEKYKELENEIITLQTQLLSGAGNGKDGGIYNDQIDKIMDKYHQKGYKGVYAIDEIDKIPTSNKMGFVLNLDPHDKPGSHWVAVYIDADDDQAVEYYDSFGKNPPEHLREDLKKLVEKINPENYLKFKINRCVQQRSNSNNCGVFAMKFLMDRFDGKPFPECSGYSDIIKSEKMARKFRSQHGLGRSFGFI